MRKKQKSTEKVQIIEPVLPSEGLILPLLKKKPERWLQSSKEAREAIVEAALKAGIEMKE
ncbi:MAG: hypothetical protein AB2L14_03805 [Candidatus Xenobiia bacterium LiM19]